MTRKQLGKQSVRKRFAGRAFLTPYRSYCELEHQTAQLTSFQLSSLLAGKQWSAAHFSPPLPQSIVPRRNLRRICRLSRVSSRNRDAHKAVLIDPQKPPFRMSRWCWHSLGKPFLSWPGRLSLPLASRFLPLGRIANHPSPLFSIS